MEEGADDGTVERIREYFEAEPHDQVAGVEGEALDAIARCIEQPDPIRPPCTAISMQRVLQLRDEEIDTLRAVQASLKDGSATTQVSAPQHSRLEVFHCANGDVDARVVVLNDMGIAMGPTTHSCKGQSPPYVLTADDRRPSEADTVRLFNLCEEQVFPFRWMADTLRREYHGEADVPHMLLALLGGAGKQKGAGAWESCTSMCCA